jgi:hypothetical protein
MANYFDQFLYKQDTRVSVLFGKPIFFVFIQALDRNLLVLFINVLYEDSIDENKMLQKDSNSEKRNAYIVLIASV